MGPRNGFDISDIVDIGGVEIKRINCILKSRLELANVMKLEAMKEIAK